MRDLFLAGSLATRGPAASGRAKKMRDEKRAILSDGPFPPLLTNVLIDPYTTDQYTTAVASSMHSMTWRTWKGFLRIAVEALRSQRLEFFLGHLAAHGDHLGELQVGVRLDLLGDFLAVDVAQVHVDAG